MAMVGTAEAFESHFPFIRPSHVTVYYGEPFYIKELEPDQRKHAGAYTREKNRKNAGGDNRMKTPDLKECREKLDGIDREIVRLFEERMAVCGQVAEYKIETGKAVYDGEREKQKLAAVREMAAGDQNKEAVEELFTQLMTMSRRYQYSLLCARKKTPPLGFTEVEEIRKGTSGWCSRAWRARTATRPSACISGRMQTLPCGKIRGHDQGAGEGAGGLCSASH